MNQDSSDEPIVSAAKRRYSGPAIVDVGSIVTITTGKGSPVGDPPQDGTTGYYNSAKSLQNDEVDLDGR